MIIFDVGQIEPGWARPGHSPTWATNGD